MLVLVRKGNDVYHESDSTRKLTIVEQKTKGPGKEVVKIEGLPGSNGQKWVSLSKLNQGANQITCQAKEVTTTSKYQLTAEESKRVKELQEELNAIIANAKSRYVPKPSFNVDPSKMSEAERRAKVEEVKRFYGL